jgi:hypothetical protein
MKPVRPPFVGTRPGLAAFETISDAEEERESNRRWRHTWFMWAMITTGLALLFLVLFVAFAVLYANQYPQCSLKDMHFTSAVTHAQSTYPILQHGTAFYRNAAYGHKLTSCETWLLRDLEKLPAQITGPLNGVQSKA